MKIIGGKFGLPENLTSNCEMPQFLKGSPILLFNARSGIKVVVDAVKPRTVWLPSYLCPTIISAINLKDSHINFYPIDKGLHCASFDLLNNIEAGDLFLFIDYFGFPFNRGLVNELHARSVITFQDCSQALFFDPFQSQADFCLFSPRKFLGVPDGGILHVISDIHIDFPELTQPPEGVLYQMLCAVILRREFDLHGGDRTWNTCFHKGEDSLSPAYTRISDVSLLLLKNAFGYQEIIYKRKRNYECLLKKLGIYALFNHLPESVIPLGFPIKVEGRDRLQQQLFEKEIFPPIHWDIREAVPGMFLASHQLSNKILTLPCDQRYDEEDMNFVADAVLELIR